MQLPLAGTLSTFANLTGQKVNRVNAIGNKVVASWQPRFMCNNVCVRVSVCVCVLMMRFTDFYGNHNNSKCLQPQPRHPNCLQPGHKTAKRSSRIRMRLLGGGAEEGRVAGGGRLEPIRLGADVRIITQGQRSMYLPNGWPSSSNRASEQQLAP